MKHKNMKIILTGAHSTGKSTLVQPLATEYKLPVFQRTVRNFWEANGVNDFELLPSDVRAIFQKHLLLNQLEKENTLWEQGFITDRSVLDYLGYAVVSSSMSKTDLDLYKALIRERLLQYDYIIYLPVEFPAEPEYLRANPQSQAEVAEVLEEHLNLWLKPEQYCIARGSVEERLETIKNFIQKRGVELRDQLNILRVYQELAKKLSDNYNDLGGNSSSSLGYGNISIVNLFEDDERIKIDNFDHKYFKSYLMEFRKLMNYNDTITKSTKKPFFEDVLNILQNQYPDDDDLNEIKKNWYNLQNNYSQSLLEVKAFPDKRDFMQLFLQTPFHLDTDKHEKFKKNDYSTPLLFQLFIMEVKDIIQLCVIPLSNFIQKRGVELN